MNATERNVQLIREGLEAFSRGDLGESLERMHPDVEWHVVFRLRCPLCVRKNELGWLWLRTAQEYCLAWRAS